MSSSEIESWIASSNTSDDITNGNSQYETWQRDSVLKDWPKAMDFAQRKLLTSKTKIRLQFLQDELLSLARHGDMNLSQTLDIFKLLTRTYPRYVDSESREAVEAVGMELVKRDELRGTPEGPQDEMKLGVTEQILGWLANEVGKISKRSVSGSYAPADVFVLLSWTCGLYTTCLHTTDNFTSTQFWKVLAVVLATLLDVILNPSTHAKPSMQKSALVRTRRVLRSKPDQLSVLMSTLLSQAKSSQAPLVFVPLIGLVVDVTIRLKNVQEKSLTEISSENKTELLTLYNGSILMSKSPVPSHALNAMHDFIETNVSPDDFSSGILPTMEKVLLRSPEYSMSTISCFIAAYPHPISSDAFHRLLTSVLNSAKSANPLARSGSVALFESTIEKKIPDSDLEYAATELLALPKANKTAGPDHRIALYSMTAHLKPSSSISALITGILPQLVAKETNDVALALLSTALSPHISFLLSSGEGIPSDTTSLLTKEMNNPKSSIRRAFCVIVGEVFWTSSNFNSEVFVAFSNAILPAFETNIKNVATNPLNAAAGPLEGYIALAVLLGPLARSGKHDAAISRNASIQSLSSISSKPSFLLFDKVYQKLTESEDEKWLLRACEGALSYMKADFAKNELLRVQIGMVFLHLTVDSPTSQIRRSTIAALESNSLIQPQLVGQIVKESLTALLGRDKPSSSKATAVSEDENEKPAHKQARLAAFLASVGSIGEGVDLAIRENLMAELIILGHHPTICGKSLHVWIELCQKCRADPHNLVVKNVDKLFDLILEVSTLDPKLGFLDAASRAMGTLAFVAPDSVLPRLIDQLRADINPNVINGLSDSDIGIWLAPEGTTFVNVLSSKKTDTGPKKGKGAEIERWEADIRKSLADKKAANTTTLSKQDQAAVQAQLEKETITRIRVADIRNRIIRGLQFIHTLVGLNIEQFRSHISVVSSLLLEGTLGRRSVLVGEDAVLTFLDLAQCSSTRLDNFQRWVGVATLRSLNISEIPEEMQAEPLNLLIIRVLYRLRTLSEQTPFDAATFSYAFPLFSQVLTKGGILPADDDEALEQVALVLDVIKFHSGEFMSVNFPRKKTMAILLHVIRNQPKLTKEASSTLIDIGEAMHTNATREEINVLIEGALLQEAYARNACLQALQPFDLTDLDWSPELWVAHHDDDEQNSRLAQHVWEDNGLDIPEKFLTKLLNFLGHENAYVRSSSATAIADAVKHWPQTTTETLNVLQDFYREKAKLLAPEFDELGMVIPETLDRSDPWPTRLAISRTFELLAASYTPSDVEPFFAFLLTDEALGDRSPEVRRGFLTAGSAVIDLHGASRLAPLIRMFETHLGNATPATETNDQIKEAVVILFGRVARHFDPTDTRIPFVVNRLIEALKTPAEQVQMAVSDCLAPLVKLMRSRVAQLVDNLLNELSTAPKYAARRGAAYGLAGVIKGTGIAGIKEFNIINRLQSFSEDKKLYESRQGAMFAFETLSTTLGRLFEPYVTRILPLLLTCFGDGTSDVREATQDAARVIMANMSGYGVKLILPSLLSGLDEKQWRSKKGSIELLGMMAYCSPKQLSLSLPVVIPRLTDVLTDSHAQVRSSANKSLKQFGEVISNPEIQSLTPVLLKALVDPAKTPNALASLLKTSFMHYIDHSSLALVIPIIERGLRERGADTKKKAAQIVGNLASLTDAKDFVPYLSALLPMVHNVLVDPVPEARATAAKSLGTLVERLGEIHFPDLVPGLLRTLKTDTSGVDRQGAAQGLSEVLSGLGMERLEGLLPDIIANAQSPRSTVREGFMSLLVFLPVTFGTRFQPHLPKIISPILSGLADNEEYVREAAMRAGRMIVSNYSKNAIDLLLPELEQGMFDPGWRIRQSSITLVGELLFKVSGISGKAEIDDEEEAEATSMESSRRALIEVLGEERKDRILSALYLSRQDAVNVVRTSSIHIWKALVSNTPRTVREILPQLMGQIVFLISSSEFEQVETASRTTAEVCRKFGEKILVEIIPILRSKLSSTDPRTREGVCLTICETMENTTESQREGHEDVIISMVRMSLVDDESNVRSAAARAFDVLQDHLGVKAIDQTIPTLLEALRQPGQSSGTALQALKEVMSVRSSTVFPVLIPTLIATPMTVFNARALASLVTVADDALSKRLTVILNALVKVTEDESDEELLEAVNEALVALFGSINDAEGLNTLMLLLLGWATHHAPKRRASACDYLATFCAESEMDASLYRVDWIRRLISSLDDQNVAVHTAAWSALDAFVKSVPKDELEPLVVPLRRTIEGTGSPGHHVPGFSLPKGVSPMVPIIIAGLTTGSNEQREQAAYAIGDLVERTEESAIKPFVVPFTGPLIRVATQATTYPPSVKTAILSALTSMLERIPIFVKPFFPQLQRTFVKSTSDPASVVVRTRAAQALGVLMRNQPRVDPVITELIAGVRTNGDGIAASLLLALSNVIRNAGTNVGEKAKESCLELAMDAFKDNHEDNFVLSTATLVKSLSPYTELLRPLVETYLVAGTPLSPMSSQTILAILSVSEDGEMNENLLQDLSLLRSVAQKVKESAASDKPIISRPAREARDILKEMDDEDLHGLF